MLFSLLSRLPKSLLKSDAELSTYRKLCAIFDHTEPSVIAIYDAHKLNQEGVQIVARVARYLKRGLSNWKILLISDDESFASANLFQLPLDQTLHGKNTHSEDRPRASFKILSGVLLPILMLMSVVFILYSQTPQKLENPDNNTQANEQSHQSERTTDSQHHKPVTLEQPSDTRWLSNEEFNKIIERFENPPAVENNVVGARHSAAPPQTKALLSEEMIAAVHQGDTTALRQLVANGESLSGVNPKRQTALILASINGNTSLVNWLIDQGSSVNDQDVFGRTALYYSAVHGNLDTAEVLLKQGANSNLASSLNKTPLMAAVHNNYVNLADLLLRHRARLDIRDHSGWSAIFYAVWNDNLEMVERLMKNKPNLATVDNSGNSLTVIAKARNHNRILLALNLE